MAKYRINSECGMMRDIEAEDIAEAKAIYSRSLVGYRVYPFVVDDECPGAWWRIWEDGQIVESVGQCE